jgi:hypothetical protein
MTMNKASAKKTAPNHICKLLPRKVVSSDTTRTPGRIGRLRH